jgi:hypothetical protein
MMRSIRATVGPFWPCSIRLLAGRGSEWRRTSADSVGLSQLSLEELHEMRERVLATHPELRGVVRPA